ncbi:MAG: histidine phosphatase family protein [Planctomycetes bacterium]|nr:histidine phosphatase family protein [Planctomycetota bacterium]
MRKGSGTIASPRSRTPWQVVDDLRERNSGDWLKNFRSDAAVNAKMARWDYVPPSGESIMQATQRALGVLHSHNSEHNTTVVLWRACWQCWTSLTSRSLSTHSTTVSRMNDQLWRALGAGCWIQWIH